MTRLSSATPSRLTDRIPRPMIWVPRSNLAWFALLFAIWVLVDISLMRWLSLYAFVVSAPLALAVILKPNSCKLFVALAAASLWAWWLKMPFVVNVIMVGAVFSILILTSTGLFFLRHRRMPTMEELEPRIFPIIRVAVPVVWLFAVLHKTNWDFLDPEISCAVQHYQALRKYLPFLPTADGNHTVGAVAVWTAWFFEFSVPVLLLIGLIPRIGRRFIIAGMVLALGFHFVMSINRYQNFSALGMAFYIPFMPKDLWRSGAAFIGRADRRWRVPFRTVLGGSLLVLLGFGLAMWMISLGQLIDYDRRWPGEGEPARVLGWLVTTLLVCPAVMIGWAGLMFLRRGRRYEMIAGRVPLWSLPVFALVAFNGLCPYLGLKTENSFAMFSNVLTEGHLWNHCFLPESIQVFGFQDRMVTVHHLAVPGTTIERLRDRSDALGRLAELTDEKFRVVEWELVRLTEQASRNAKHPIEIRYEIDGEHFHHADLRQVPVLTTPHPYLQRKLMMFRWVPNNPKGVCLH